jgi:hypothetical protein
MIYKPQNLDDPILRVIGDDPVRPEIPVAFRITENREVLILLKDEKPQAVVCVAYMDSIPTTCEELFFKSTEPDTVIFYTIWSYTPGAGRELIFKAREHIISTRPSIKRFVTLSPPTEMAKRFHLKNGATEFRKNLDTVNYEYA